VDEVRYLGSARELQRKAAHLQNRSAGGIGHAGKLHIELVVLFKAVLAAIMWCA
jgi:hypothetical protein